MSIRPVTYSTQDVLDYLEGNFPILEDGFESDIESENDLEPEIIPHEDLMEPDDEIDLRNVVMEDEEADDTDNGETSAAGRPNNYSFEGLEWTDAPEEVPAIPEFRENVGPAVACSAEMSPLDYFLLFVDNHMLTSIVRETNRFAIQCLTANGKDPNSWVAVTLEELKAPRFDYCHEHPFHKLFKLRPFLESLQANFTRCYNPHKEQAIDEAMIKVLVKENEVPTEKKV